MAYYMLQTAYTPMSLGVGWKEPVQGKLGRLIVLILAT